MTAIQRIFRNPYIYVIIVSYYAVWLVWDSIKLPYGVHSEIISYLPSIQYNPANNVLRFLLAVFVPPLACLALWFILNTTVIKRFQQWQYSRAAFATIVVGACLLLSVGMGIVQNSTNPANNPPDTLGGPYGHAIIDPFHEGETLGPAISYQQKDLKPYRDFVIVHGVFQDPLRTNIAFKLFGQSIGASRAFAVMLGIAVFIAYYGLLLVLFRGNLFKSAMGLGALSILLLPATALPFIGSHIYGVQLPFRDIATILFLISAIIGFRTLSDIPKKTTEAVSRKTLRTQIGISAAIGFIAIAGFANSIDRAIYIIALSVLWLVMMYFMHSSSKLYRKHVLLPYGIGAIVGVPVLGLALKWDFVDFFDYLITISKYKEYLDGIVFSQPNMAVTIILLIATTLVTIFGAQLLTIVRKSGPKNTSVRDRLRKIRAALQPFVTDHAITILLFFTALMFLRSAIGRALPDHFIYSIQWLYLLLIFSGINYIYRAKDKRVFLNFFAILFLGAYLALFASLVKHINISQDTFPIHVQDKDLVRKDYLQTANYLKKNLKDKESFVTLTSEGSWYYLADKPSPIKYPIIWYAFTAPERQTIANSLTSNKNIKYVVTNNNWTSNFDYVPNPTRFPEVYSVLTDKYVPYVGFGQQTIWIRK